MAENTEISWADATWSPWTGCTKISPACTGCYAANLMDTRMHRVEWGEAGVGEGTRALMSEAYWKKPLAWNRQAAAAGKPMTVFPSLCDPFDTAVPPPWRRRFVELMEATPNLLWLLLTKRIGNVRKLTSASMGERPLPPNVALGGTFANQEEWDRDWWKLAEAQRFVQGRFTFGSFEPLLGPITFRGGWMPDLNLTGGETDQGSHKARPTHPDWFRGLRDQALAAGKIYHHKQNGQWVRHYPSPGGDLGGDIRADRVRIVHRDHHSDAELCQRSFYPGDIWMKHVSKSEAGRLLDGVLHDGYPEVRSNG